MSAVVCLLLTLYWLVLILTVVSSWFRVDPYSVWAKAIGVLRALTDPILKPLRSVLPPVMIGGAGLDLSPILVFLVIGVVRTRFC